MATEDMIPENLTSVFFTMMLSDESLLIGFRVKGSRYHSHIYQKDDILVAHVTENLAGGEKVYSERIEVPLPEGASLLSMISKERKDLPGDTVGIFFNLSGLTTVTQRLVAGECPADILETLRSMSDAGETLSSVATAHAGIPIAFEFMKRLVEWEIREPGILPRYTLDEARKQYPLKMPCFVEIEGKWLFANLEDTGVTVFPDGLSPEALSKIFALTRLGPLLTLPVETREGDVRMDEEFMKQLTAEYEKRIAERKESEEFS